MERYRVDIRFPQDKASGTVVITGLYDNVEDAKEHLLTLAEDYVSKVAGIDYISVLMTQTQTMLLF